MGHHGINLNNGISGLTSSINQMRQGGVKNDVKIYGQQLTNEHGQPLRNKDGSIQYSTYASDKFSWTRLTGRTSTKADTAEAALTQFVDQQAKKHNFSREDRLTAMALVANVFRNRGQALEGLQRLAEHLEDAAGNKPWATKMRQNQAKLDTQLEKQDIFSALKDEDPTVVKSSKKKAKQLTKSVFPKCKKKTNPVDNFLSTTELLQSRR